MADTKIKKITINDKKNNTDNIISSGKETALTDFGFLEDNRQTLKAEYLTRDQIALGSKINEIIDAFSILKGYLSEETLKKIANILVGENGFDLLKQLSFMIGSSTVADKIATKDFVNDQDAALTKTGGDVDLNFIRKDLLNLTPEEKAKISEALVGLTSKQISDLSGAPDVVKQINNLVGTTSGKKFLELINKYFDQGSNALGDNYEKLPFYLPKQVDEKILAATTNASGSLIDKGGNLVFARDEDKGKQILLTKLDGSTLSIDDPNALTTKTYVDEGLNKKIGIKDGLVDLTDQLIFFKGDDSHPNTVKYRSLETGRYVNQYDADLVTVDGVQNVSVSQGVFSIYDRLRSIGNEFTGKFASDGDWVEYEFNSRYLESPGHEVDGVGDILQKVRIKSNTPNSTYKFSRNDDINIEISSVGAEISVNGTPQDITKPVKIPISTLFQGVDYLSSYTKFRAYINGGVGVGTPTDDGGWNLLFLSMRVHPEFVVRRMMIVENKDFKYLEGAKQDKLEQPQIDKIDNLPDNFTTATLNGLMKQNDYDFVRPGDATLDKYLAIRDGSGLLLQNAAGDESNTIYQPNSVVPKHWIETELNKIETHSISGQVNAKFDYNADLLTASDTRDNPGDAAIGEGYKGNSRYSHGSTGAVVLGGNFGWQAGDPRGSVYVGYQSGDVKIGEGSTHLKLGGTTHTTEIGFGDGTAIKNTEQNGVISDAKIYKKDGTAGISLEKLATIEEDTEGKIKLATVANDWELVEDVPTMKFDTSPGTGTGGGTTAAAGIPWLTDKYADLTAFENNATNYEVVKYNINKDTTNNAEGILFLVKVGSEVKEFRTWEEVVSHFKANDWKIINAITKRTFASTPSTGGTTYNSVFGDLSDPTDRTEFMNHVSVGKWYEFSDGGDNYIALVHSGDKTTSFKWTGFKIIDGANGKTPSVVNGQTTAAGNSDTSGSLTSDAYSPSINLPSGYAPTQYMPTDAIKQLIIDTNNATVSDATDPTWRDLSGTQSTQFNPSQITIDLTNSGLAENDNVQFLLGSTGGNMVLDGSVNIYGNAADASRNGYVAGQYKWYAYKFSDTVIKFVMDDSKGALTNQSQTIAKVRNVSPDKQPFTAHYTSQAAVLKGAVNITGVNTGASQEITLPAGITTDNLTGVALTVSGSTDWYEVEGWDKVTAFYVSVTNEASNQVWWVEYKIEAVQGDKTKLKVTNFKSGNVGTDNEAYNAHWIAFKGGR